MSSELCVGDAILVRSIYDGTVRSCGCMRYVGESDGRHVLYRWGERVEFDL